VAAWDGAAGINEKHRRKLLVNQFTMPSATASLSGAQTALQSTEAFRSQMVQFTPAEVSVRPYSPVQMKAGHWICGAAPYNETHCAHW
jgi:hypothetical protein